MKSIGSGYKTLSRITDGISSVILELTNDSHVIPVAEDGENYVYANTTANLYEGNQLVTSGVTYTTTSFGQIEGVWNEATRTYQVTNMFEDMGKVNIKATYKGKDYEANFVLAKVYNGEDTVFVDLTNNKHIFVSDFNGNIELESSVITEIIAYSGSEIIPLTSVILPTDPIPGLKIESLGGQRIKITAFAGDELALAGGFEIIGKIGYQSYKKDFEWVKLKEGEPGQPGLDGLPGQNGTDGRTSYFHVKYSPVENPIPEQMTEVVSEYIGTYVDFTEADSDDPNMYSWVRLQGIDGENGTDGIPGINGEDGQTSYLHIKYAPMINPTAGDMTEIPDVYIGTYVDFIKEDSIDPTKYTWARFQGIDGQDGEQGPIGPTGPPGLNGADGVDGTNGTSIIWKGSFAAHPSNPQNGWAYYNTTDKKSYVYQDNAWYQMTVDGQDGIDGNDGEDGLSIEFKGELVSPPANPQKNWVYKDLNNGIVYIYTGTAWEVMTYDGTDGTDGTNGKDGVDGEDGLSVFITYNDSLAKPLVPLGDGTSNGWHTDATEAVVWMSQKISATATGGTWSPPIKIKGEDGQDGEDGLQGPPGPILDWVQDWDDSKIMIGATRIITPRLFAGALEDNLTPTGVALGRDVFGTTGEFAGVSGIAGYKAGLKTYHLTTDGHFLVGQESANYMKYDGDKFIIKADGISIGAEGVATESLVQLTAENLELKFSEGGGYNFLYNGDFKRKMERWGLTDGFVSSESTGNSAPNGVGMRINGQMGAEGWLTQYITEPNALETKRFTTSCYMYLSDAEDGVNPQYRIYSRLVYSDGTKSYHYAAKEDTIVKGKWTRVSVSFQKDSSKTLTEISFSVAICYTSRYIIISQAMIESGLNLTNWTPNPNETYDGITKIDRDGITVSMNDGQGEQGFTKLDYEGLSVYNAAKQRRAWFGQDDTAKIETLEVDNIYSRHLIKWSEAAPSNYYIAPTSSGDGTGRDTNNKSNSINHTLNWIWNTYGCYEWRKDYTFYIEGGTYNEDIYIGGWLGSGVMRFEFEKNVKWYGSHHIEENSRVVYIHGNRTANTNDGCEFIYRGTLGRLFSVRNSVAWLYELRAAKEGWSGATGTWNGYEHVFALFQGGSRGYMRSCDIVGFQQMLKANDGSLVGVKDVKGHCFRFCSAGYGSMVIGSGVYTLCNEIYLEESSGGFWNKGITEATNSQYQPKDAPPPPPPPSFGWFESTYTLTNLKTVTEGSGDATSNRSGEWGQGKWGTYQPHRGYATVPNNASSWCSGGRNFTVWITLHRVNSGGYSGAVPKPKLKQPDGSFWNSNVAFARNDTKTIQLPSTIASAIASGSMKTLEMWAGTSKDDYSMYDTATIKIKCEKPI